MNGICEHRTTARYHRCPGFPPNTGPNSLDNLSKIMLNFNLENSKVSNQTLIKVRKFDKLWLPQNSYGTFSLDSID